MVSQDELKKAAAKEVIKYIDNDMIIGVGTGSTVNFFIEELANIKGKIQSAIASSKQTEALLKKYTIPVDDLNNVGELPLYIDGTDEFNDYLWLIKGGGGALTREKIIAANAKQFICIADESKHVNVLGKFPLPIEVIPMARSYVAREIRKLGGDPEYRDGFITDNGNVILDVYNLHITKPVSLEETLNNIPGIVANGIFARRGADKVLLATNDGIKIITAKS